MKLVVLDGYALNPGDLSWDALRKLVEVEVYERTPAHLTVKRAEGAALLLTNKTPLPAEVLRQLADLRYIGVLATGYNIVDTVAAKAQGILVANVPTYGTASVAQFTFALLLELCHHVGRHAEAVRGGAWQNSADWSFWQTPLVELSEKTMGIIGYGRIGREVGRIAAAFGMRVLATGRKPIETEAHAQWVELNELLTESDVVSLHCPLTPETQGMMSASRLARMKQGAFLLNTSRGPLIREQDLVNALAAGHLAGAALDVLSVEPPVDGSPLLSAPNCLVTPHIAWATREARSRLMAAAVANVGAFLAGEPVNVVNA